MEAIRWCVVAFGGGTALTFGWAMVRFFRKPTGPSMSSGTVAALATCGVAWDVWALAAAPLLAWRFTVATAFFAGALALFFWARHSFGRYTPAAIFEPDVPGVLIDSGPYRFVRHPFYTSYILFWLGGWVGSGSRLALLALAVMSAVYVTGACREETLFRASPLARRYAQYRRRSGLVLPTALWRRG